MTNDLIEILLKEQKEKKTSDEETIPGRKEQRYPAGAQVKMGESSLLLKDVSLNGGCIQSEELIDIVPNSNYTCIIVPEEESRLNTFEVDILSRWVRMKRTGSESGFIIIVPPGSRVLESYIEFLKSKGGKKLLRVWSTKQTVSKYPRDASLTKSIVSSKL
ncbi:MAG: hypothetical protein LBK62_07150 [Treponema sp.]|jgi:hypothetical protein|nr:hypothetical protein [Treponema sp.]